VTTGDPESLATLKFGANIDILYTSDI
jgi:hypothetical protein